MTAAEEKRLREWKQGEKTVTLTKGQWSSLTIYLQISSRYREDEAKSWEKLAEELDEEGNPKYKNAHSNAKFWEEMNETIKSIKSKIDGEYSQAE
ncbi:MAG: hypothetical protein LBN31_07565 [Hungatella sp.]|jgi:hypothetical protein|nr:hypothetical protein [Hungatella sp.]